MHPYKSVQTVVVLLFALLVSVSGATAQGQAVHLGVATVALGTAFTYQGQLVQNGTPLNATCDLQFGLWDAPDAGTQIGTTQIKTSVSITRGLFTIPDLNFGAGAFDGNARWLEIAVRCPAGSGSYTPLSPRQALTPAPYALYASAAPPTAGSPLYIQNGTAPQTGASFNIGGSGAVSGTLSASRMGIGTTNPSTALSLDGASAQTIWMERNTISNTAGSTLTLQAGGASVGATDRPGGDLVLAGGVGTGTGGGGNVRVQTASSTGASGTGDDLVADRLIVVSKAKAMTLPGIADLMSIHLTGTQTAGGRIRYMIRATDGGSQVATESGVIQYLATATSITCAIQLDDKLHLGTVNSNCSPGFFSPGAQPGVSIFDNVSFASPAPVVVNEVYFTIENESGSPIRLEP